MSSTATELSFPLGTTARYDLTFARADGTAIDLTGAVIRFMLFTGSFDAESLAILTKAVSSGITLIDALAGLARLQLDPADTAALDVSTTYRWRIRVTLASGEVFIATAHQGSLEFDIAA